MIKEIKVKIKLNAKTIKHYWELGYVGNTNDEIIVDVKDLTNGSHVEVTCICKFCGGEFKNRYKSYLKSISNHGYYCCHKCCTNKKLDTYIDKYDGLHPSNLDVVKRKREESCLEKYGSTHYFNSDIFLNVNNSFKSKVRNKKIKNGFAIPDDKLSEWEVYKRKCRNLTRQQRELLLGEWDGVDYYDGEYIAEYLTLGYKSNLFPTLDHKISLKFGFDNNITPEQICEKTNLCFTKKKYNCSKRDKNEYSI